MSTVYIQNTQIPTGRTAFFHALTNLISCQRFQLQQQLMLAATLRQTFVDFGLSIRNTSGSIPSVSQLHVQQDNVLSECGSIMLSLPLKFVMEVERELASVMKLQAIPKGF